MVKIVYAVAALVLVSAVTMPAPSAQSPVAGRLPDTVYIPTPRAVVLAMLQMANVGRGDVVYDLGSGDGRIVIAAVKEFGAARGVGVELDGARVREARENARRSGVGDRIEFRQQDLFETDLHSATVVALYLSPTINTKLRPKFIAELPAGARIVSHAFDMDGWAPAESRMVDNRPVFLWRVTAR